MKFPPPVIVVPGITAAYLTDEYALPPDVVWSVMTKDFTRIRLHPGDTRYEADEPARVVPGQLYEVAYKELIAELRHGLTAKDDQPVPVFPFSYDWRMPLEVVEQQLTDFVQEVIDRTKLMRHYGSEYADDAKVNLVGHSMGGLVIAGYLANQRGTTPVSKVATLATPFRGSFEAIIKVLTGTADLGTAAPSSREREAARVMPSLYHLMPTVKRGLQIEPGLPTSIFDPGVWQPSVRQTIEEFVRLYAVDPGRRRSDRIEQANDLFTALLKTAAKHSQKLESFKLANIGLEPSDWLAIVGVGSTTRVKLNITRGAGGKPEFKLESSDRANEWNSQPPPEGPDQRYLTGDGTVPFDGAQPAFLAPENLVCVTPDDYGYWELSDRMMTSVAGFHGILPNMDMLHRLIVRHFTGAPDRYGNTWGRPAPGVSEEAWAPAVVDLKPKS